MTDFFDRLEYQQRLDLLKIGVGSGVGVLITGTFMKIIENPQTLTSYAPTIGGALVGACLTAASIERYENKPYSKDT